MNDGRRLLHLDGLNAFFWRQVNSNSIDIAVLEWCKLFGDLKGRHHWKRVVAKERHDEFESGLLEYMAMSGEQFSSYVEAMRSYRDQFIAHLDDARVMNIPQLEPARVAICHLFGFLAEFECTPEVLAGFPKTLAGFEDGYDQCAKEAVSVYAAAQR